MSADMEMKITVLAFIALIMTGSLFFRYYLDGREISNDSRRLRYAPLISGCILPLYFFLVTVLAMLRFGVREAGQIALSLCFNIFLHISIYLLLLTPAMPFLRSRISARTCAMLWLLPNCLYLTQYSFMTADHPLLVIPTPGILPWLLLAVWLAGFVIVMLRHTFSHLMFRSHILKNAADVKDRDIIRPWNRELRQANIQRDDFPLLISPDIRTPLSIGLFQSTTCVLLPDRPYRPDELSMIFRHEIIHISRSDAWSKFFLLFCAAMCWFNPLIWKAMAQSGEDMELSCDETLLLDADDDTRRQYAELILSTAGDARGFTTCLAASASSMRYRLKQIMSRQKKHTGALLTGCLFFILCMTCGYVSLAYDCQTGAEAIYQSENPQQFAIRSVETKKNDEEYVPVSCQDTAALQSYLAELPMCRLTGRYTFETGSRQLYILYEVSEGALVLQLYDQAVKLTPLYGKHPVSATYYLPDGTDWEYIDSILSAVPEV